MKLQDRCRTLHNEELHLLSAVILLKNNMASWDYDLDHSLLMASSAGEHELSLKEPSQPEIIDIAWWIEIFIALLQVVLIIFRSLTVISFVSTYSE